MTLPLFFKSYEQAALQGGLNQAQILNLCAKFSELVAQQFKQPYIFPPYHKAIRAPFDYYHFGQEFIRPLLDIKESRVEGKDVLKNIIETLANNENVILLANHQTEIDPQIISLLIEDIAPQLAEEMIFMAGHRVVTDPLATPLSLGRNLLCIYSKKYIDQPPEKKAEKLAHNQRTLKLMAELLQEGAKCIYVAPSGGRDRADAVGMPQVAPFDPDSIEMLNLIAKKSGKPTHFHTLTLATYTLLPPPKEVNQAIGEVRTTAFCPAHLVFGPEIAMDSFVAESKEERRKLRRDTIWQQVLTDYKKISSSL